MSVISGEGVHSAKYDIAVVGSGPAGMATACLMGSLNKNLKIIVCDKRPETTRNHKLAIGSDSINAMSKLLMEGIASSENHVNKEAAKKLLTFFKNWSKKSVPTSTIEKDLANFAVKTLNVSVYRDKFFNIKSDSQATGKGLSFDCFLEKIGGAKVIIGADGSKSVVRNVINANKTDEFNLGYLLELKYQPIKGFKPRSYLNGSKQFIKASGFDFETAGRSKDENPGIVTLHKFISYHTHTSLIQGDKGKSENPWTLKELKNHIQDNEKIKRVIDHFECYIGKANVSIIDVSKIVTFPMAIYRSSSVASWYKNRIVLLVGDASSGLVLERGVNKAFLESALCAKAVLSFFSRVDSAEQTPETTLSTVNVSTLDLSADDAQKPPLPTEFIQYQSQSHALFKREARWARFKHFLLNVSEYTLKLALLPWKTLIASVKFLYVKKMGVRS